ncbi:MAG: hypothetical protein GC202_11800 [Alphaproteobacteria bacterium]|nr:hypothetical protein [Alphaproteobacteria bacterium]
MAQAQGLLDRLARAPALFALAFGIRAAYLLATGIESAGLVHPDSGLFIDMALSPEWWQGSPERMPGYPIFLHFHFLVFGTGALWAPVISQLAIDACACVAIARLADCIQAGAGRWAGLMAALNPTQIVLAGVVLGDSIFMACLAAGFLELARWHKMHDDRTATAMRAGWWFGLALFNRAVLWPFVPVLALAMLISDGFTVRAWRATSCVVLAIALFAAPVVTRNWIAYGKPALSAQGGMHMALWWYPLAREAADGTPYARTAGEVAAAYDAHGGIRDGTDPFGSEAIYSGIAREGLSATSPAGILKAWLFGAAINLASPATLMIPRVMALPRTGYYSTVGQTPVEKVRNFLTLSSSRTYLLWLAAGISVEWPVRAIALAGLVLLLSRRETRGAGLFAILWIGYVLVIQGPVASAKYRLPVEPIFVAAAAYAVVRISRAA